MRYRFADRKDYIPGEYQIEGMIFTYKNGMVADTKLAYVSGALAEDSRKGKVISIEIAVR